MGCWPAPTQMECPFALPFFTSQSAWHSSIKTGRANQMDLHCVLFQEEALVVQLVNMTLEIHLQAWSLAARSQDLYKSEELQAMISYREMDRMRTSSEQPLLSWSYCSRESRNWISLTKRYTASATPNMPRLLSSTLLMQNLPQHSHPYLEKISTFHSFSQPQRVSTAQPTHPSKIETFMASAS